MKELADRVANTQSSGIRKVFDLAAKLKDPVNLSIGQPHFDVPQPVKEAAITAIRAGKNAYTPTQGAADLRQAVAKKLGGAYRDNQLLITSAVSGGLTLAYMSLLNPGDEILIPDPYFVMYKQLANIFAARPIFYDTFPKWKIDPEQIDRLVTPRTKAIVVGTPANPTGAVYTREELSALAKVLEKHNIIAISDEIYEYFCYDSPFVSLREIAPDHTLVLGGFSKSHSMTGWRVGYAAGPADLIQAMTKFQQLSFVCAPAPFQCAAATAVDVDMTEAVADYRRKRDMLCSGLAAAGYEFEKPGGAFYVFPKVPWGTDDEFVAKCIEDNLLVIPGNCFSERNTHFRVVYAAPDEVIVRGLSILTALAQKK